MSARNKHTVELTAQEVRDIHAFVSGYPLPGSDGTDRNARMTRIFEIWDEALTRVGSYEGSGVSL